jgi:hypothetical protein
LHNGSQYKIPRNGVIDDIIPLTSIFPLLVGWKGSSDRIFDGGKVSGIYEILRTALPFASWSSRG